MNLDKAVQILKGLISSIPGYLELAGKRPGGSHSAEYCYGVWLKHLVRAHRSGLNSAPRTVVELGPGQSIGAGMAALLSGAEQYVAFDRVGWARPERSLAIFDEMVSFFEQRRPMPHPSEVYPRLEHGGFPAEVLDDARLRWCLAPERVRRLRAALANPSDAPDGPFRYEVGWAEPGKQRPGTIDMLFSQSVLEHMDDLERVYSLMHLWLADTGFMSHQIDYRAHGWSRHWNGHWSFTDAEWRLIRGRRPYLLNRQPHSAHLELLRAAGFDLVLADVYEDPAGLCRADLAPRFRGLSDADLRTFGAFVQARKKPAPGGAGSER